MTFQAVAFIYYVAEINKAGIAALEIDMGAVRGWSGGIAGCPFRVPQTPFDAGSR